MLVIFEVQMVVLSKTSPSLCIKTLITEPLNAPLWKWEVICGVHWGGLTKGNEVFHTSSHQCLVTLQWFLIFRGIVNITVRGKGLVGRRTKTSEPINSSLVKSDPLPIKSGTYMINIRSNQLCFNGLLYYKKVVNIHT